MVTIDPRAGSAQLAPLLRQRGVPVDVGMLTFGALMVLLVGGGTFFFAKGMFFGQRR